MIWPIVVAGAVAISFMLKPQEMAYKRRYRRAHPGCAWIPLCGASWKIVGLQGFAFGLATWHLMGIGEHFVRTFS